MRITIYKLHPVEKEEDRQTIFKRFASSISGGVKRLNIIKEEDEEKETNIYIIITGKEINEDGVVTYEHFSNNELIDHFTQLQGRVVFTELGSVQRFS